MFKMREDQMKSLFGRCAWGTLCTAGPDGGPYAIEFSYFLMDDKICAMINPKGTTAKNLAKNPQVCFKVCLSDHLCEKFEALSCFGTGCFEQDRDKIALGWDLLEERLGLNPGTYSTVKERFKDPERASPLFVLTVEKMTGVANHKENLT
jgi:nitroimidazol reductase NimA-like FMN-containing flavoprotein (pyridoxamine 5'-phosphate oxidase superfamily)